MAATEQIVLSLQVALEQAQPSIYPQIEVAIRHTNRGVVINEREHVSVTPDATVTVLLEGDDLQVGAYGAERIFLVRALYDSTLGSNIPLIEQAKFVIERTPVAA